MGWYKLDEIWENLRKGLSKDEGLNLIEIEKGMKKA